jgi:hypothetical protein
MGTEDESNVRSQYTEETQRDPTRQTDLRLNHGETIVGEENLASTIVSEEVRMSQMALMSSTQTSQMNTIINRPMIFNNSVPADVPGAVIRQAKTGEHRQRRPLNNDIKDLVNEVVKVRRSRRMRSNV